MRGQCRATCDERTVQSEPRWESSAERPSLRGRRWEAVAERTVQRSPRRDTRVERPQCTASLERNRKGIVSIYPSTGFYSQLRSKLVRNDACELKTDKNQLKRSSFHLISTFQGKTTHILALSNIFPPKFWIFKQKHALFYSQSGVESFYSICGQNNCDSQFVKHLCSHPKQL